MTFEDKKLEIAINALKATQKLCASPDDDVIENIRNRFKKKVSGLVLFENIDMFCHKIYALTLLFYDFTPGYNEGYCNL